MRVLHSPAMGIYISGVIAMPKLKTNRGAAKRFRAAGKGKGFKCRRSFRNHMLSCKSTKRKRHLRETGRVDKSDVRSIDRMLPYAD